MPSVFSHEILNANPFAFLDDAPLEERRARAVEMRRFLPETDLAGVGRLDPAAIAEVRRDAWPDVRDADELHDALLTLIAVPEAQTESWTPHFTELAAAHRAARGVVDGAAYWVAAERARTFHALLPGAAFDAALPDVETATPTHEEAVARAVQGWMAHLGPTTALALAGMLHLETAEVDAALLRLEAAGTILRGSFLSPLAGPHPRSLTRSARRPDGLAGLRFAPPELTPLAPFGPTQGAPSPAEGAGSHPATGTSNFEVRTAKLVDRVVRPTPPRAHPPPDVGHAYGGRSHR